MSVSRDNQMRTAYRQSTTVPQTFLPVKITETVPTITTKDVELGSVTRYFACPSNESAVAEIFEINSTTFTKLKTNNFYAVVSVPWLIRGPVDPVTKLTETNELVIVQHGVIETNKRAVEIAAKQLQGLDKAVTNYVRFYQGL